MSAAAVMAPSRSSFLDQLLASTYRNATPNPNQPPLDFVATSATTYNKTDAKSRSCSRIGCAPAASPIEMAPATASPHATMLRFVDPNGVDTTLPAKPPDTRGAIGTQAATTVIDA